MPAGFLQQNYLNIAIIVFVVLGLLVLISIKGINLNAPNPPLHLVQTVTVETFDPALTNTDEDIEHLKMLPAQGFCASYEGNSAALEPECNQLTETNCAQTSCCGYIRNRGAEGKCVAGGPNGPTYTTEKSGEKITYDKYYYLGEEVR